MTPQPEPLLDIRERPNGYVVIKRYPFETAFNADEWNELCEYCASHSSRPAPPAPAHERREARGEKCCKGCEADMCAEACQTWINEHDAQVAKTERARVLGKLILFEDRLQERINCTESDDKKKSLLFTIVDLCLMFPELKSLRSEQVEEKK